MISLIKRGLDSDVGHSFRTSPTAIVAAVIAFICVFCAVFAPWVAPHNPFDLTTLELSNARLPPAWSEGGSMNFMLGTDDQGRDILSSIMYGTRLSLVVGLASVVVAMTLGITLGLLCGYLGGAVDALIMREQQGVVENICQLIPEGFLVLRKLCIECSAILPLHQLEDF